MNTKSRVLLMLKNEEASLKKQVRMEEENFLWACRQYGSELAGPPSSFYKLTETLTNLRAQIAILEQCSSVDDVKYKLRMAKHNIVTCKSEVEVLTKRIRDLEKTLKPLVALLNMMLPQEE